MLTAKAWVQIIGNILSARFESTSQKLILMFVFAGLTFGAAGLGAMLLMTLLANSQLGKDASAKHGISASESSRLGGFAIAIVVIVYIVGLSLISPYTPGPVRDEGLLYLWCAIFLCCLLDFLAVLVNTGEEIDFFSAQALVASDDICQHFFIRVADVRGAIGIVDGSCQIKHWRNN